MEFQQWLEDHTQEMVSMRTFVRSPYPSEIGAIEEDAERCGVLYSRAGELLAHSQRYYLNALAYSTRDIRIKSPEMTAGDRAIEAGSMTSGERQIRDELRSLNSSLKGRQIAMLSIRKSHISEIGRR